MKTSKNTIFQVLNNSEEFYEGNLWYYFSVIFKAPNVTNPYHNLRHLMYVMCMVYEGGMFMKYHELFGKRNFRALLIAAMFHDYNHDGKMGNDEAEIERSIKNAKEYLLPVDHDLIEIVSNFIRATQFLYVECEKNMGADIIRDADMSQLFDDEWLQQIIFGLSREMSITAVQMLQLQLKFVPAMVFHTQWAEEVFVPIKDIRLAQVRQILENLS